MLCGVPMVQKGIGIWCKLLGRSFREMGQAFSKWDLSGGDMVHPRCRVMVGKEAGQTSPHAHFHIRGSIEFI